MQKYYRLPWTKEKVETLVEFWPHFGTQFIANLLEIKTSQIKAKVNKLKLKLLPKNQRLCAMCKRDFQFSRWGGIKCKECHLARRKTLRLSEENLSEEIILERWIKRATNTIRKRSKNSDLDFNYMMDLWKKQNGVCFYSEIKMIPPKYGSGRNMFSASVDRIDSAKDYVVGNVVWAIWACNAGKNEMPVKQYFEICNAVAKNTRLSN